MRNSNSSRTEWFVKKYKGYIFTEEKVDYDMTYVYKYTIYYKDLEIHSFVKYNYDSDNLNKSKCVEYIKSHYRNDMIDRLLNI